MKWFRKKSKRIGLALGGGGARGLAQLPVLETLDELGVRPYAIAGTSIGAVMGSLYASGLSGKEISGKGSFYTYLTQNPVLGHSVGSRDQDAPRTNSRVICFKQRGVN